MVASFCAHSPSLFSLMIDGMVWGQEYSVLLGGRVFTTTLPPTKKRIMEPINLLKHQVSYPLKCDSVRMNWKTSKN